MNRSGTVDIYDIALLTDDWLKQTTWYVSAGPGITGDITGDGRVDYEDLAILADQWLQPPANPSADIAPSLPDGIVNFLDFALLAKHWLGQ